jgi:hypothetical protein
MNMTKRPFKTLPGVRVPPFVHEKIVDLTAELRYSRHPQSTREDVIGALIDNATVDSVAAALDAYNPKLGKARQQAEQGTDPPLSRLAR